MVIINIGDRNFEDMVLVFLVIILVFVDLEVFDVVMFYVEEICGMIMMRIYLDNV